jgi:NAD(P)-dependent dehydrogenase (short-subunit alcohol dehydrogenase family)
MFSSPVQEQISLTDADNIVAQDGDTYNKWQSYGQAKTANMLMALSLAKKLGETHGLLAFSLHPGFVFTHLSDHMNWWEEQSAIRELMLICNHRTVF